MNHPPPSLGPAGFGQTSPSLDEKQKASRATGTLAILKLAALGLPGLLSQAVTADQGTHWVAAKSATVGIQAGADYTPTGASRLLGQLAKDASSTQRYKIGCYDDGSGAPKRLRLRIQGMTAAAKFFVTAKIERNGITNSVVDSGGNGDQLYSEYAVVNEGAGDYFLTVTKSKKSASSPDSSLDGAMVFQTMQECNTASGAYTGVKMPEVIGGVTPPPNPTPPPNTSGPISSSKLKTYSSSLGKKVDSKTFFVTCEANKFGQDTARYKFQVKAANPNRPFNLRITAKKNSEEAGVIDPINGDKLFSELTALEGGNGKYQIIVSKDSATVDTDKPMSFAVKHVCETQSQTQGKLAVTQK